jgi:hypothetical protein
MSRHFSQHKITPFLSFGDLLEGDVGQRHRGVLLRMAKAVWPRWLLKRICKRQGLYLSIEVMK